MLYAGKLAADENDVYYYWIANHKNCDEIGQKRLPRVIGRTAICMQSSLPNAQSNTSEERSFCELLGKPSG